MTTGHTPAIDPAWALPAESLSPEQREARTEAVLELRGQGRDAEYIVAKLGVTRSTVANVLAVARNLGDVRALTKDQAQAVTDARAAQARARAEAAEAAEAARQAPRTAAAERSDAMRVRALAKAEECREYAIRYSAHPNVRSSFLHLADLVEAHGLGGYPTVRLKDEGDAVTLTRVPRALSHSPVGSPAAACLGA